MHLTGVSLTSPSLIGRCTEMAAVRSRRIVEFLKSNLEEDKTERAKGNMPKGFIETIILTNIPSNCLQEEFLDSDDVMEDDRSESPESVDPEATKIDLKTVGSVQVNLESSGESTEDENMEVAHISSKKDNKKPKVSLLAEDSSEEEETVVLK